MEENETQTEKTETSETTSKKQNFTPYIILALLFFVVIIGVAVSNSRKKQATPMPLPEAQTQEEVATTENVGISSTDMMSTDEASMIEDKIMMEDQTNQVRIVEVEGGAFYFKPDKILVKKGDTVKIVLSNAGGLHDWVIDEFNARTKQIQTGETASVEFVADKIGEFEFYCSVGNHREMGMKGTLIVTE